MISIIVFLIEGILHISTWFCVQGIKSGLWLQFIETCKQQIAGKYFRNLLWPVRLAGELQGQFRKHACHARGEVLNWLLVPHCLVVRVLSTCRMEVEHYTLCSEQVVAL